MDTGPISDLPEELRKALPQKATELKPQDPPQIREALEKGHAIFRRQDQVTWKILLHNHGRGPNQHHVALEQRTLICSECDSHLKFRDVHSVNRFTSQHCDKARPGSQASFTVGRLRTLQRNLETKYQAYNKTQRQKLVSQKRPWTHAVEIYKSPEHKRGWAIRCMRCDDNWDRAEDRATHDSKKCFGKLTESKQDKLKRRAKKLGTLELQGGTRSLMPRLAKPANAISAYHLKNQLRAQVNEGSRPAKSNGKSWSPRRDPGHTQWKSTKAQNTNEGGPYAACVATITGTGPKIEQPTRAKNASADSQKANRISSSAEQKN